MKQAKVLRQRVESAVANLLGLVGDAGDMRVGIEVEPDQLADQRSLLGRAVAKNRAEPFCEFGFRSRLRVAVENLEARGEKVAQQAVGYVVAIRLRPALEEAQRLVPKFEAMGKLRAESALAQPGVPDHRHERQASFVTDTLEGFDQSLQLRIAAHHSGLDPIKPTVRDLERTRLGPPHEIAANRFGDALDHDRRLRLNFEHSTHMPIGVVADSHAAGRRGLLHARGDVDRETADAALGINAASQQHRPGVEADAHVEARQTMLRLKARGQQRRHFNHRKTGSHSAFGVVFERLVGAEHSQQAVAGVLQNAALPGVHDRGQALERGVHHRVHVFGVELLAQVGRADHVHEQHRHRLQPLLGRTRMRPGQCQLLAQRRERHFRDRVSQHCALRFERCNRGFDLFGAVFHSFRWHGLGRGQRQPRDSIQPRSIAPAVPAVASSRAGYAVLAPRVRGIERWPRNIGAHNR